MEGRTLSNSIETVLCLVSGILLFWRKVWRVLLWIYEGIRFLVSCVSVARKVRASVLSLESLKGVQAMTGKIGIKDTLELIGFGLQIGNALYLAKTNDGVINGQDLPLAMPALLEMPAAIEGIANVVPELADLQEEELLQIKDLVLSKIPGVGEKWKSVATHALMVAQGGVGLYNDFKPVPVS